MSVCSHILTKFGNIQHVPSNISSKFLFPPGHENRFNKNILCYCVFYRVIYSFIFSLCTKCKNALALKQSFVEKIGKSKIMCEEYLK